MLTLCSLTVGKTEMQIPMVLDEQNFTSNNLVNAELLGGKVFLLI